MNVFIALVNGSEAVLTAEESWHCARVLRCRPGETIRVIDGKGHAYDATLTMVTDKRCEAEIAMGPFIQPERGYRLHLAIAPTKQIDRIEWMLEKAVEIGVDEVTFIQCRNSERVTLRADRMRKIAESAVKQSLQSAIPKVNGMVAFSDFVHSVPGDMRLIAHCFESEKKRLSDLRFRHRSVVAAIGPEGDFTEQEVTIAQRAGFEPVTLGANRLRTETAGLFVVQAAALLV